MITLSLIETSAVVAFVVVLETLISGKVADGMTKTKFNQRKEVLGVGLANIASGLFGGIPASGVFARTAINVRTGATSQWSQGMNSIVVALLSLLLLPYFKYIPLSIIASILVYASIRMVTGEHFKKLYRYEKTAFWIAMAVAAITVVVDATMGILVGTLVSLLVFAKKISTAQCNVTVGATSPIPQEGSSEEIKGDSIVYRFAGELTYINSKSHIERLRNITTDKALVLNFRNLFYIDVDGIEALDEIFEDLNRRQQSVFVTGLNEYLMKFFTHHAWYETLLKEQRVLGTTNEALSSALILSSLR